MTAAGMTGSWHRNSKQLPQIWQMVATWRTDNQHRNNRQLPQGWQTTNAGITDKPHKDGRRVTSIGWRHKFALYSGTRHASLLRVFRNVPFVAKSILLINTLIFRYLYPYLRFMALNHAKYCR